MGFSRSIDLSKSDYNCWPRIIWQQLFDFYREKGGDLSNLDNLLIDYRNCSELFLSKLPYTFIFGCSTNDYATTWIPKSAWWDDFNGMLEYKSYDHYLKVCVSSDSITVEEIDVK